MKHAHLSFSTCLFPHSQSAVRSCHLGHKRRRDYYCGENDPFLKAGLPPILYRVVRSAAINREVSTIQRQAKGEAMNLESEIKKVLRAGSRFLIDREVDKIAKKLLPVVSKYVEVYIHENRLQKPF